MCATLLESLLEIAGIPFFIVDALSCIERAFAYKVTTTIKVFVNIRDTFGPVFNRSQLVTAYTPSDIVPPKTVRLSPPNLCYNVA